MRNEITAAVLFLVQLIEKSEKFSPDQLHCFQARLVELLMERFKNHWFPDKPFKGKCFMPFIFVYNASDNELF